MENNRKLEFTLCGMLPYGLEIECRVNESLIFNTFNWGARTYSDYPFFGTNSNSERYGLMSSQIKPLLHSMDKLTEPILYGGLIPMELILNDWNTMVLSGEEYKAKDLPKNPAYMENWIVECLKEWHFNIYDLPSEMYIEK